MRESKGGQESKQQASDRGQPKQYSGRNANSGSQDSHKSIPSKLRLSEKEGQQSGESVKKKKLIKKRVQAPEQKQDKTGTTTLNDDSAKAHNTKLQPMKRVPSMFIK